MDRVHVSMDRPGALSPPCTDVDTDSGHGGVLTRAQPPAAPVRQSSPVGAQQREERTRSLIRASPGLERRRGGQAMMVRARWCRHSVRGRLEHGEREMWAGRGAMKLGEGARLL
jgi:hypothetical protein